MAQFGLPPNGGKERTFAIYRDTLVWDTATTLAEEKLFVSGINKGAEYQNYVLGQHLTTLVTIIGLRVVDDMVFNATGATAAARNRYYENSSFLQFRKEGKEYAEIPIAYAKSQIGYNNSGAAVREKFEEFYELPDKVQVVPGGRTELVFKPGRSIATLTPIGYVPNYWGAALTTDLGNWLRVELLCVTEQYVV